MQYQRPNYPEATGQPPGFLSERLIEKYGTENVVWPVILGRRQGDESTVAYIYERNHENQVNSPQDNRPNSRTGIPNVFLDYTDEERQLPQDTPRELLPLFGKEFERSYDFIQQQGNALYTVDIDLMWNCEGQWRALEFTTYNEKFTSEARAEHLLSTMNRRPSWQKGNQEALRAIVEAADDLSASLRMVAVNTTEGVNQGHLLSGNAYWFPLSHAQINRLASGRIPEDGRFGPVSQFLRLV